MSKSEGSEANEGKIEIIPDNDLLFRKFRLNSLNKTVRRVQSNMFEPSTIDKKVSTEWAKYSSVEQIKNKSTEGSREDYSVVEIYALEM